MLGLIKYGNETDLWRMWDCLVGYLDLDHNEDALSKRDKRSNSALSSRCPFVLKNRFVFIFLLKVIPEQRDV